ncbi:DUF1419 domain-containing protein [Agrobacterium sp. CCNWLW32]|uniref:DUF1419 domain-containing protein n=2 Tax=Rhizobium/Agrobacterium group TaxID=227290 RepID=UPI00303F4DFD
MGVGRQRALQRRMVQDRRCTPHDYAFEILPLLSIKAGIFAMREFPTGLVTSILFSLSVDGCLRHLRGYCDLADKSSPERMRSAIIERESRPSRAMTHDEKLEHIWSSTADDYRVSAA